MLVKVVKKLISKFMGYFALKLVSLIDQKFELVDFNKVSFFISDQSPTKNISKVQDYTLELIYLNCITMD